MIGSVLSMKIGVALSGCDIGGVTAYNLLTWLSKAGLEPELISASGLAAVGALLYASRYPWERAAEFLDGFCTDTHEQDLDTALSRLAEKIPSYRLEDAKGIAILAVNVEDGKTITFTNDYAFHTHTLCTYPLKDAYDILSAAAGAVEGLASYPYRGYKLTDYSVRHGHPVYPMQMLGKRKILSFSFLPQQPQSAYDALLAQQLQKEPASVSLHIPIHFPSKPSATLEELEDVTMDAFQSWKPKVYLALAGEKQQVVQPLCDPN